MKGKLAWKRCFDVARVPRNQRRVNLRGREDGHYDPVFVAGRTLPFSGDGKLPNCAPTVKMFGIEPNRRAGSIVLREVPICCTERIQSDTIFIDGHEPRAPPRNRMTGLE